MPGAVPEPANPGLFIGQPLNVDVFGGTLLGAGAGKGYRLLLTANVVKKK